MQDFSLTQLTLQIVPTSVRIYSFLQSIGNLIYVPQSAHNFSLSCNGSILPIIIIFTHQKRLISSQEYFSKFKPAYKTDYEVERKGLIEQPVQQPTVFPVLVSVYMLGHLILMFKEWVWLEYTLLKSQYTHLIFHIIACVLSYP